MKFSFTTLAILCFQLGTTLAVISPWPSSPDIVSDCYAWLRGISGDDCISLATRGHVKVYEIVKWNPRYIDRPI
ncbi:hypothetical protein TWF694_001313 [Orbilia ellipsospora]|uniref:LysM domain-containing protein n=1 Tax=Orbilia ellipsospora TaxID=2528407 RepID=A0AAV9XRN0_9PEZI